MRPFAHSARGISSVLGVRLLSPVCRAVSLVIPLALLLAWPLGAESATRELAGQISRVVDGDTLWFRPDDPAEPLVAVRLRGIDAPESCQAWGRQATAALREQFQGRPGTLRLHGQDDYRRTLGTLRVAGQDVNGALVEQGHAWAWRDAHGRSPYLQQEASARARHEGLHADPAAETPWDFRQRHGRCRH